MFSDASHNDNGMQSLGERLNEKFLEEIRRVGAEPGKETLAQKLLAVAGNLGIVTPVAGETPVTATQEPDFRQNAQDVAARFRGGLTASVLAPRPARFR